MCHVRRQKVDRSYTIREQASSIDLAPILWRTFTTIFPLEFTSLQEILCQWATTILYQCVSHYAKRDNTPKPRFSKQTPATFFIFNSPKAFGEFQTLLSPPSPPPSPHHSIFIPFSMLFAIPQKFLLPLGSLRFPQFLFCYGSN